MFLVRGMDFFGGGKKDSYVFGKKEGFFGGKREMVNFLVRGSVFFSGKERWLLFW